MTHAPSLFEAESPVPDRGGVLEQVPPPVGADGVGDGVGETCPCGSSIRDGQHLVSTAAASAGAPGR